MDHNSYKEQLSALLDGELNETERAAALEHLAECEECRTYFAELTAMHDALTDLDEAEPPADFAAGVLARLHEEAAPQKTKKRSPWRGWAALAACAAVAALAIFALPGKGSKSAPPAYSFAPAAEAPAPTAPAPTAPAATETASTPADYYGFAGEANDGYDAAEDVRGEMEAGLETSLMTEPRGGNSAGNTTDIVSSEEGTKGLQEYTFVSGSGEDGSKEMESPPEDTVPTSPGSVVCGGALSQTLTLVGEGAAEWLAENAEPLGNGFWLVSVEAVNELPDTLELVGLQEPQDGMLVILFGTPENPQ